MDTHIILVFAVFFAFFFGTNVVMLLYPRKIVFLLRYLYRREQGDVSIAEIVFIRLWAIVCFACGSYPFRIFVEKAFG